MRPSPQIVESLSLSRADSRTLSSNSAGVLGAVLADVLAWEIGGENFHLRSGTAPADVERCYLQALAWATEVCGVLDLAA